MSERPLIERVWESAQGQIGAVRRVDLGRIDPLHLERFAVAVDGSVDADILGLSTPLFLSSVLAWGSGPLERDLLPDGNAADPFSGFDVAGLRIMAGGQELTFHRDLLPGATVTLQVELESADIKNASSGPLLVLTLKRAYYDESGLLSECCETFLGREALA